MRDTAPTVMDGRVLLNSGVLKRLRKTQGFSQETLAYACLDRRLCVSVASIKRAETGKPVLYRTARHLASVFGVEIDALIAPIDAARASDGAASTPLEQLAHPASARLNIREDAIRYGVVLRFTPLPGLSELEISTLIRQFGGEPQPGVVTIASFGVPQAYGSDSKRGLLCAMALMRAQWVDARQPMLLDLQRWGEALVMPPPRELLGHPIPDATVLVAQTLVEQLSAWFEFAMTDPRWPGYRICLRLRESGKATLRGLAGRAIEMLQFRAVLDAMLECQDGHVVYVRGMAGIGKTRLLEALSVVAREAGFACHIGEFHDFGVDDGWLWLAQLVRSLVGLSSSTIPMASDDEPKAAAALRNVKLPEERLVFLQVLLGLAPDAVQRARYDAMSDRDRYDGLQSAICHVLLRLAVQRPLLICIEDLHWADAQTLALLGRLLAETGDAPIVWLLSSRQEGDPLDAALRPHFSSALSVLELAALRPREAALLAAQFASVDAHYRAECIQRAQGNPLYLTQLLANHESEFPNSLRHLIQTRIDRLAPAARNALRYAAVFGHRFELAPLRQVIGDATYLPEQEVRQMMVKEVEPGTYAFVHDLVMHCVYDSIPAALRRRLHAVVAALYQGRDAVLYAQHLERAGDAGAFDALLAAMRDKLGAYRYAQALELGKQCESLATQRMAAGHELALLQGQASAGLGRMSDARDHLRVALRLAESPPAQIDAVLVLAPVLNALDCLAEEERLLEDTLPLARAEGADAELARLLQLHGNIYFPRGDYLRCRQLHHEALHHARLARHAESEARALSGVGDSHYAQGRMRLAYETFDQCIQISEQHGLLQVAAGNLAARGSAALYLGQPRQALHDSDEAIARSGYIGDRRAEVFARLNAAWIRIDMGEDEHAQEALDETLALARQAGISRFEPMLLEGMARLALRRGEQPLAWRLIAQAAGLVEQLHLQRYVGPWVYGSMALIADEPALRHRALAQGEALLVQGCLAHNALRFHVAAAEIYLLEGRGAEALRHARELRAVDEGESYAWIDHHVRAIEQGGRWLNAGSREPRRAWSTLRKMGLEYGFAATMPIWSAMLPA